MRANGAIDQLSPGGTVLGVFAESTYEQGDFALRPGDRLILYTDGITEGRNPAGDEFGEESLAASALRHRALGADDMLAAMLKDVEGFNAGVYEDDATLIVGGAVNHHIVGGYCVTADPASRSSARGRWPG